jgi:hypothetical protein
MTSTLGPVRPHRLDSRHAVVLCPHRRLGTPHPHSHVPAHRPPLPPTTSTTATTSTQLFRGVAECDRRPAGAEVSLATRRFRSARCQWQMVNTCALGEQRQENKEIRRTANDSLLSEAVWFQSCGGGGARRGKRGGGDWGSRTCSGPVASYRGGRDWEDHHGRWRFTVMDQRRSRGSWLTKRTRWWPR